MKTSLLIIVLIASLGLCSCSPGQVVQSLQTVITAAEIALPVILAGTNISAADQAKIVEYVSAVAQGTDEAALELASNDSTELKAIRVAAIFTSIATPHLSPGTPQRVMSVISLITSAVVSFLDNFQPNVSLAFSAPTYKKVSTTDAKALDQIRNRAQEVTAQLQRTR
jgi:hypothetical protein